ncbi:MAG TPA: hypothetical protein VGH84_10730 [Steroidobacteraceae bacterium]|jgi:hypothetical protein
MKAAHREPQQRPSTLAVLIEACQWIEARTTDDAERSRIRLLRLDYEGALVKLLTPPKPRGRKATP